MAPRRGEHDRSDRDRDAGRGQPAARRVILQDFFLESEGVSREVLTVETPKYLGPEATCRPGMQNGQQGFFIRASRPFTPDMIEDLRNLSAAFESENRSNQRQHYEDKSYMESDTRSRFATNPAVLSQPPNPRYVSSGMAYGSSIAYTSGPGYQATPSFSDPSYLPNQRYPTVDPGYGAAGPAFPPGPSRGNFNPLSGPDQRFEPNYVYAPQAGDYSRGPTYDSYGGPPYADANQMMTQRNMPENFPYSSPSTASSRTVQDDRFVPRDYDYRPPQSNVPYGYDRPQQHPFQEQSSYDRRPDRGDPMDYADGPRQRNFGPPR